MKLLLLTVFIANFVLAFSETARYDNYRVYAIDIENDVQLNALRDLEKFRDGIIFVGSPNAIHQDLDLIVPPHKRADISEFFEKYRLKTRIKTKNLQK